MCHSINSTIDALGVRCECALSLSAPSSRAPRTTTKRFVRVRVRTNVQANITRDVPHTTGETEMAEPEPNRNERRRSNTFERAHPVALRREQQHFPESTALHSHKPRFPEQRHCVCYVVDSAQRFYHSAGTIQLVHNQVLYVLNERYIPPTH